MSINYLRLALRHISAHKLYAILNISGLAVGMAVSMLILLYIRFESSYDAYHENADRIYRVTRRFDTPAGYTPHFARCPDAWVNNLPDEFPEIESLIRFQYLPEVDLRIGEAKFRTARWFMTDAEIFDVFSFPLVQGHAETALRQPYSVVLTEGMARKYFGSSEVLGKEIIMRGSWPGEYRDYKITGIMRDLPPNSHFQIDFLASYPNREARQGWAWVYILLKPGTDPSSLEEKFPSFIEKHTDADAARVSFLHLQALTDIHLRSHLDREIEPNGDIRTVGIFGVVAILIMLIACFNFMNLSTARSLGRAREIGMRKVLGAYRGQLIRSFFFESMLYAVMAFLLAVLAVVLLFPSFNAMLDNRMDWNSVFQGSIIVRFLGFCLVTGLFAGSYPAFVLSSFQPMSILSGGRLSSRSGRRFEPAVRRTLVVFQFTLSIGLIVCTMISGRQFEFLSSAKLGMNKDQILAIQNVSRDVQMKFEVLKNELMSHPRILCVSASSDAPSRDILDAGPCRVEGLPEDAGAPVLAINSVDADYIDCMGIELAAGHNLDIPRPAEYPKGTDLGDLQAAVMSRKRTYLINESALKIFGWNTPEEALGKRIDWRNALFRTRYGEIVGVVRDYHYASLRLKIRPLVLFNEPLFLSNVLVKTRPEDVNAALNHMETVWDRLFPDLPLHFEFLDDMFAGLYMTEQRQGRILAVFSGLAVLIAYLGLFGLASYAAERRTKEIGIRKVVGATVQNILIMLFRAFTRWIVLAAVVACPIAYFLMNRWLRGYAYRIDIPWWPFAAAVGMALLIALITVSAQSIRAATANPVEAIRYE